MMFLDCPAYRDQAGAGRCGLPAAVRCRFIMHSSEGPLESAMIRCPAGHSFTGPIESLARDRTNKPDPGTAAVASRAGRNSLQGSHDGRDGRGGSAIQVFPGEPEPAIPRLSTAPAYYLGHPARLWITVMRPRRGRTTAERPREAAATEEIEGLPVPAALAGLSAGSPQESASARWPTS